MKKQTTILLSFLLILILAACGGTAETEPTTQTNNSQTSQEAEPMEEPMMDEEMADDDMMDEEMSDDMMEGDASDKMDEEMMNDETHSDDMMDEEMSDDMMDDEMADEEMMDEEMADDDMGDDMMDEEMSDEAMNLPAWQQLPIVNVQTGETFTLADFAGKTVFVEPMATWCSNCRRQLGNVQEAKNTLNDEDVVFIALSVETNISAQELANYAGENQFNFIWAVMSPELLQALSAEFGQTVANPPATPHFIISPDGTFSGLVTGIEPAGDLIEQINTAKG